jgi:hypothetical protein
MRLPGNFPFPTERQRVEKAGTHWPRIRRDVSSSQGTGLPTILPHWRPLRPKVGSTQVTHDYLGPQRALLETEAYQATVRLMPVLTVQHPPRSYVAAGAVGPVAVGGGMLHDFPGNALGRYAVVNGSITILQVRDVG